ncbi:MAG TPA: EF-hand domain-containing protein [Brevundimonas sp.]|nr:EF-hand domain-containing protein [Brevundimonas sp.]
MLTLIALSALMIQDPPRPGPAAEMRSSVVIVDGEGRGGLDRDGDGQVSREEFSAPLNDHFGRMDKNGDGRLSTEEMSAGHGGDRHEITIRRDGDQGGPGMRHFELRRPLSGERGDILIHRGEGDPEGRQVRRFEFRTPADGDRSVMLREGGHGPGHPHVIRRMQRDGAPSVGDRIEVVALDGPGSGRSLDTDNDGRLSEAEFTAPLRDAFARMDADRSGFVEEGERGGGDDVRVFTHRIETRGDAGD